MLAWEERKDHLFGRVVQKTLCWTSFISANTHCILTLRVGPVRAFLIG